MEKTGIKSLEKMARLSKADLHIHTNHSDGRPSVLEVLEYVENETDLDAIAIADHDTMDGYFEAVEIMKKKKYRFVLIPGEEVTTQQGHILALFIKKPIQGGLTVHHTLKRIKEQNGIRIAAHPFQHVRVRSPEYLTMDGIGLVAMLQEAKLLNGVETINATPTLGEENLRATFVNRTLLFKAETGSSDAHIKEAIGRGYTLYEGKSADDLKVALRHHQTQAMHGSWTLRALLRYAFFFIPKGFRMLFFTLLHGRAPQRLQIINVPE
ncbi:MAG: PHP-associated domain-containing protein [Candidatus Berkelbacteria bacterium]